MSLNSINVNNQQIIEVDNEPTTGSENLVKSGGVDNKLNVLNQEIFVKSIDSKVSKQETIYGYYGPVGEHTTEANFTSNEGYTLSVYPVETGKTYLIKGDRVGPSDVYYGSIMFCTTPGGTATLLAKTTKGVTPISIELTYEATQNGYIQTWEFNTNITNFNVYRTKISSAIEELENSIQENAINGTQYKGIMLMDGYNEAETDALENLKFVRFFGNIDVSELRIGTIYNDSQIPRRILIKRPGDENSMFFDFPQDSNYMKVENSQFAVEIYYDWDNHTSNVNYTYNSSHIQVVPFALNPYVKSAVDKLNQDIQEFLVQYNYAADYIGLSNLGQVLTDIENNVDDTSGVFNTKVSRAKYIIQPDPHFTYSIAKNYNLFVSELRKYLVDGNATLRIEFDIYNCGSTAVSYTNGIRYLNPGWVVKSSTINLPPQTVVHFAANYAVPAGETFSNFSAYDNFSANIPDGFIMTNLKLYIVAEPKEVSGLQEIKEEITSIEEQISQDEPIAGKTIAIMGDSIMMLMRTNSVSNTVSYLGTDGNTYARNQLTLIKGILYVTSSLSGGSIVSSSIRCEVVNSDQAGLDAQTWPLLKNGLNVNTLYNLGLGGAIFADRGVVTAYPYNDGNGEATDLPNEVRWLLRKVNDKSWNAPDAIIIWLGTNGAGEPSTDNYNEIMALDYEYLDSLDGYSHRQSFYGGLRWSLETLYRNLPYSTILLVSPVQTNPKNYRTYTALSNTAAAIKKMGHRYACQFIDALNEIGVVDFYERPSSTPYKGSDNNYYALSDLTEISGTYYVTSTLVDGQPIANSVTAVLIPARFLGDGLHPSAAGKVVWTNYLIS